MAAALNRRHIQLAKNLPPKLLNFFAKYPPKQLSAVAPTAQSPTTTTSSTPPNSSIDSNPDSDPTPVSLFPQSPQKKPFTRNKDPITGKKHEAPYSLRRQADLVKLARRHGVEELLPPTVKSTKSKLEKQEKGLRVRGTGIGRRVKGHWHERTLQQRLEKRREAMANMPAMIREWKSRGHGRGWKTWPS